MTESETRDKTEKNAFGGAVVKVLQTKYGLVFKFKFMESKTRPCSRPFSVRATSWSPAT